MECPVNLKRTILQEANDIIHGERKAEYGAVTVSFERIAQLASIFTRKELTKFDVCWVMAAVKISRQLTLPKRDNLVDLAGYTGLMQQLIDEHEGDWPQYSKPFEKKEPGVSENVSSNYEFQLKKYLAERELSQPKTGVMNDYKENAEKVGWKKGDEND